ncbi:MAG: PEP-CTERM sorting domain-containing protein [Pirellulales bacterium]
MRRFIIGLLVATLVTPCIIGNNAAYGTHLNDPFGGVANRSLVLDNHDGGSTPSVAWPFVSWNIGQALTSATIEFDLYMAFSDRFNPPSPTTSGLESWWTYVDFRVGDTAGGVPSTLSDTVIFDSMRSEAGGGQYYFDNGFAPGNGHPMTPDAGQHVKYSIDLGTNSYTVEVTPHAVGGETNVQRNAGVDDNPIRNAFIFDPEHSTFDTFAIGGAWNPSLLFSTPFYLDNVKVTSDGNTLLDENFDDDPIGGLADTPVSHFAGAQDQNGNGFTVEVVGPVPEPSTLLLALLASIGLINGIRRR